MSFQVGAEDRRDKIERNEGRFYVRNALVGIPTFTPSWRPINTQASRNRNPARREKSRQGAGWRSGLFLKQLPPERENTPPQASKRHEKRTQLRLLHRVRHSSAREDEGTGGTLATG